MRVANGSGDPGQLIVRSLWMGQVNQANIVKLSLLIDVLIFANFSCKCMEIRILELLIFCLFLGFEGCQQNQRFLGNSALPSLRFSLDKTIEKNW